MMEETAGASAQNPDFPEDERHQLDHENVSGVDIERMNVDQNIQNPGDTGSRGKELKSGCLPEFGFGLESAQGKRETSPVEKAMSNSVVLRRIASFLDARSLVQVRRVSRQWKEEATLELLSPRHELDFLVNFQWSIHSKTFSFEPPSCENEDTDVEPYVLTQLVDNLLQHSKVFPVCHFQFLGGTLVHPALTLFFSEYGRHVKHLKLTPNSIDMETLGKVLLQWTPNLKSLILQPKSWTTEQNLTENNQNLTTGSGLEKNQSQNLGISLSNLKYLTLPLTGASNLCPGSDLICDILTCAPNLISIVDPHLAYVPQIIAAGKFSLVKSLTWSFCYNAIPDEIRLLSAHPPSDFSFLDLEENFFRFVAAGPQLKSITLKEAEYRNCAINSPPHNTCPAFNSCPVLSNLFE